MGFEFFTGKTTNHPCFQFFLGNERKQVCSDGDIPLKEWHTAVVTYNGQVIKMYLDGEVKTLDITENIAVSNSSVKIGTLGSFNNLYNGIISDTLVMNKALSDDKAEGLSKNNNFKDYAKDDNTLIYNNLRGYEGRENGTELPMDIISTMQVWIPRYKYKVWNYNEDGNTPSDPKTIEIIFEEEQNKTGEITCKDNIQGEGGDGTSETCRINNQTCTDALCNEKTYTHPGFTFGDKELTGFWVGKFELSSDIVCTPDDYDVLGNNCNLDTIRPLIKPNLYSWRGVSISTLEDVAFAMKSDDNKYGFSNTDDTHIIKNSEWGAVAYLSHSKYGKGEEVGNNSYNNNSDTIKKYMTGCGPESKESSETTTTCNSYEKELGQSASTTGNIYGVYDMAGGTWEYTMTILSSKNKGEMITGNSGYSGLLYNNGSSSNVTGITLPDAKYYDKYSYNEADNIKNLKIHKLGDGTREIYQKTDSSTTNGNVNYGWYDDYNHSLNAYSVWANRGGYSINTNKAGIFASYQSSSGSSLLGCASIAGSSRLIILSK